MQFFLNSNGKRENKMTLPNFDNQLPQRTPLYQPLEELISGFFLLQPTTKFVADKSSHRYNRDRSSYESERPISSVKVFQDSKYLGYVRVTSEEYRGFGLIDLYYIGSGLIKKSRGSNRTEIVTKDPHKAIKVMQEYFKPKPNSVFQEEVVKICMSKIDAMFTTAKYRVDSLLERSRIDMYLYLLEQHEGMSPALPARFKTVLESSDNLQHLHNLRIVKSVHDKAKKGGAIVTTFSDSTIWYVDMATGDLPIVKMKSTYELPTNYQEKLALLKLCDSAQPVDHVGVRFNTEIEKDSEAVLYYLVSGDTVVTC
jgi:hypothetical protein